MIIYKKILQIKLIFALTLFTGLVFADNHDINEVLDLINNDLTVWEDKPLKTLANKNQLVAYKHNSFWHPLDTLRDKVKLNNLWNSGKAPWKIWD